MTTDKENLAAILARIEERLSVLNYSETFACKKAEISKDNIRDIRRNRSPSAEKIISLAPVLQCRLEWLLTGLGHISDYEKNKLTPRQKAWLEHIDKLPEVEQKRLWKLACALAELDDATEGMSKSA